jgi:CRISPR-associated protein Csm4
MSSWQLFHLQFGRNAAHFGELGIGIEGTIERVRSDTLFSAWVTTYARLYSNEQVEMLLKKFCSDNPPFRLSSTFIYDRRSQPVTYYLPHPQKKPRNFSISSDPTLAKDYKKLKYLPLETWQAWYQSDRGFSDESLTELLRRRYGSTFEIEKIPKVAVDRATRATNFYYTGIVRYHWQQSEQGIESLSGLYFLVHFSEDDSFWQSLFQDILEVLGQEGLGGERSSGAGQFTVQPIPELPLLWKQVLDYKEEKENAYSLISLLWQNNFTDADLQDAAYELQERGGWITSPQMSHQRRRKSVQMFTEGSVFSKAFPGMLADVKPEEFQAHPIYRSGIALSLPIRI